jgi:chemotaxis protein methyltransferase CheR
LHELELKTFAEYVSLLFNEGGLSAESDLLADYISTNKTEFFREADHFAFLNELILPRYSADRGSSVGDLQVWSAGCSSGQEAYSIAIQIEEYMLKFGARFGYSILATDISKRMLKLAREAIYPIHHVDGIPIEVKKRYFLKSKSDDGKRARLVKSIREKVSVAYLNLMDERYPFHCQYDIIFLRNTLIYFDPATQLSVLERALECLKPSGYLFIGHSESLINLKLPIKPVAPSVYVKL